MLDAGRTLEKEEREETEQHDFHHVVSAARFQRMGQQLEEHRAEQRTDGEGNER